MNLRQQIIQDQIESTANSLKINNNKAFQIFSHCLYSDQSIYSFDYNDDVDGGQDKQIDTITIEDNNDEATVYITQSKNELTFSSNQIIKIKNGLNWIFNKNRADIETLTNIKFKDKIKEYREVQSSFGPSNIYIKVAYLSMGLTEEISDECKQEIKTINDEYNNNTFASFNFEVLGAQELVDLINSQERSNKKIDAELKITYDANTPSLIKYHTQGLKGIICTVSANDIATIVNKDQQGFVFDLNIRRYLGKLGQVNKDILHACSNNDISYLFWFLNNGITIVCDKVDPITDPDKPMIKIENMQIVNGCQTAMSLATAQNEGSLKKDTRVLLRIYETMDNNLVDKIVLTTNNQNKISGRNLRANDSEQTDLSRAFKMYGYYYERKPREFINENTNCSKIVPNEVCAAAYLSIVLKRPSDARTRKYKIWSEYYDRVFSGKIVEPYLISYIIFRKIAEYLRKYIESNDDTRRFLSRNASYHISRMTTFFWRKNNNWSNLSSLKKTINKLESKPDVLDKYTEISLNKLIGIIKNNNKYFADINSALKSSELDEDINKILYRKNL